MANPFVIMDFVLLDFSLSIIKRKTASYIIADTRGNNIFEVVNTKSDVPYSACDK